MTSQPIAEQGWVLVPAVATEEMLDAGLNGLPIDGQYASVVQSTYDWCLSAAPAPSDEVIEAMARAHSIASSHELNQSIAAADWDREADHSRDIAAMRQAVAVLGGK